MGTIQLKKLFEADMMNGTQIQIGDGSNFRSYYARHNDYVSYVNKSSKLPVSF